MAATNYTITAPLALALKGDAYRQLTATQQQKTNLDTRVAQLAAQITTLQSQLRAVQVQVLGALSPPVVVAGGTPIVMTVNNDGSVTLAVGN